MKLSGAVLDHERRTGAARVAHDRQAAEAGPRRRTRTGPLLRVLRRRRRQAARRDDPVSVRHDGADDPRAARRHRPHHSVELSDADLRSQRRCGAGGRQRLRRQAGRGCLPVAAARRRAGDRRRLPGRRAEHRHRLWCRGRRSAGRAPRYRPHQLYRLAGHRALRSRRLQRDTTVRSRWNSAASHRRSCSPTPTSTLWCP